MTKTITTTYYTLAELEELIGGVAVDNAYTALIDIALENAQEFDGEHIKGSLEAFATLFGTTLTKLSFDAGNPSGCYNYAQLDVEAFKSLTNSEKNDIIEEARKAMYYYMSDLTGDYADAYIMQALTQEVKEITFNNAVRILENVPDLAMYEFSRAVNEGVYDRDYLYELAEANEYYFDEHGKFEGIM